ncbi:MAG: hypothetical protein IKX54_02310 [Lachnospiraceae bacterium]|nr:hypothetical protein [Lachnospiraceae bacterium]
MKDKRFLAALLVLAFCAALLTACGGSKDSGENQIRKITETVTPTPEPTPTEVPKTPEQLDHDQIVRLFNVAETMAANPDYDLAEGSRFILKFVDDNITTELDAKSSGFERRIWEKWIREAGLSNASYQLQSGQYRSNCTHGTIIGVVDADKKIQWSADNLEAYLFAFLNGLGVKTDPGYLARLELFEKIKGDWLGTVQMPLDSLVDTLVSANDPNGKDYYHKLFNYLKGYGFTGKMPTTITCDIHNEKDLTFVLTSDWSNFLEAIKKATSSKDGMMKFLCVAGNTNERSINYLAEQNNTDVMTLGKAVVRELEKKCLANQTLGGLCTYTCDGNVITFESEDSYDTMTYDPATETITYTDIGLTCTLKKS